ASVYDQRSGGIVTLRYAILSLIEVRPMRAHEGHRPCESTDAKNVHAVSGQGGRDAVHIALLRDDIQLALYVLAERRDATGDTKLRTVIVLVEHGVIDVVKAPDPSAAV